VDKRRGEKSNRRGWAKEERKGRLGTGAGKKNMLRRLVELKREGYVPGRRDNKENEKMAGARLNS